MLRVIVDTPDYATDSSPCLKPMQGHVNGIASANSTKISLGKGPTPPVAVNLANHLVFNSFMHLIPLLAVRKYAVLFLQTRAPFTLPGCLTFFISFNWFCWTLPDTFIADVIAHSGVKNDGVIINIF